MDQPTLFDERKRDGAIAAERLLLYALGEFQARGLTLAARELPLDRLRGAIRRASETFDVAELSDEEAATAFERLGAQVRRVPPFVAKHPFRVIVPPVVAERAREFYEQQRAAQTENSSQAS